MQKNTEKIYRRTIGDIVYSDNTFSPDYNSSKTAVGVVYEVSEDGAKIVGLQEANKPIGSKSIYTYSKTGLENLNKILNSVPDNKDIATWLNDKIYAFGYCYTYEDSTNSKNWYLPLDMELASIYNAKEKVNESLGKIPTAIKIQDSKYYWSSNSSYRDNCRIW